jgi:XRE family transcriptional regulator, stress-response regulator
MPWDYCSAGFGKRVTDYSVTLAANTNWHDLADTRLVQYRGGNGDFGLGEGSTTMVLLRQLLGDVLRRLRLRQGRTLREVSASARVSLGYLSEVERGQKEASSELLAAICGALNTPLSQVFREVSDNFALAELQNEPVLGIPREPGLRVPAEASVGLDGERGFAPISTMVPEQEFADGQGGFRRASGHVHDVTDMVSVLPVSPQIGRLSRSASPQTPQPSDRSAPQTQALGFSVRFRTISGRFPDTMSASVTCSSTARSLARSAIHTCRSGSATPG